MIDKRCVNHFVLALSVAFWASASRGERLFIGVLEADGYQSVIYSASAFSRYADLPLVMDLVNSGLAETFLTPSFSCIAPSETFRVVQTVDPALPRGDKNPANVAILPLSGNAASVQQLFDSAYTVRRESAPFIWYERAKNTNAAPQVVIAISGRHLLTSTSQEAIQWAWDNRTRLIDAPAQSIPGTLRVLVNPQRLADLLGARSDQAASVINIDKLLRDFDMFSFSLTLDGQAVALAARGKPKTGSALDSLSKALRPPLPKLWNGLPDEALFASVSGCDNPQLWDTFLGKMSFRLLRPVSDMVPQTAFSGDRLAYLVPTRATRGLCWVSIEPVKTAEPVREAIRRLHTVQANDGVSLTPEPPRKKGAMTIETYSLSFQKPAAANPDEKQKSETSTLFTLMTLFLKQAVLETTVTDNHLVTVLGPPQSIDDQLDALKFSEKALTLQRKIAAQDPALSGNLCQGAALMSASLLRHIVSIMPEVKPEHLRAFPLGGDGETFGISMGEDRTLTASLRFQSSEIAALQRINKDGREALQELVFQLFSNQMLNMPNATKDAAPKTP